MKWSCQNSLRKILRKNLKTQVVGYSGIDILYENDKKRTDSWLCSSREPRGHFFYQINENYAQGEISIAGKMVIDVLCRPIWAGSEGAMELDSLVLMNMMEFMLIKLASRQRKELLYVVGVTDLNVQQKIMFLLDSGDKEQLVWDSRNLWEHFLMPPCPIL